jgi:hypothetical protein
VGVDVPVAVDVFVPEAVPLTEGVQLGLTPALSVAVGELLTVGVAVADAGISRAQSPPR